MLNILLRTYSPNIAEINRTIAYIRNCSKLSCHVNVFFLWPSASRVPLEFPFVTFHYIEDKFPFTRFRTLNVILQKIYLRIIRRNFNSGDIIYIYGQPEVLHCMKKRVDLFIYNEITEHPLAIGYRNPLTSISWSTYYNDCRKIDGIFVISKELKKLFVSQGVDSSKVHIINMTVDPDRFTGLLKQPSEPYIVYCGVVYNDKDGVDNLIKAFSIVSKKYPSYKLYIVGPIPNDIDNSININLIKEYNLSDKVILTGQVSATHMPQLLVNASICALARPCSLRAQAGFPTKLGEYLLSGNPVVVTAVGDIPDFLKNKESAIIVPPDDINLFAEGIIWLIEHPNEASLISKNGYKVAIRDFNAEVETKKLLHIMKVL